MNLEKTPLQTALSEYTDPFISCGEGQITDSNGNLILTIADEREVVRSIFCTAIAEFLNSQQGKRDVYTAGYKGLNEDIVYKNEKTLFTHCIDIKEAKRFADELNKNE